MCEQIQNRFRESEPHKFEETKWQLNQACIAYFHLDQQWYRAKIISLEAHRVKVKSYLRMFFTCSSVYFYAPEIEDRGAYCFCPVCHSVILSFCNSVIL